MAERNFDTLETLGRKKRVITGSFKPNGASAIDNTLNKGEGWTVAYTATGVYTVTLANKYGACQAVTASLRQETRTQVVEVASCDPSSAGTILIHGFAVGSTTLADITAATNTRIDFIAVLSDRADV